MIRGTALTRAMVWCAFFASPAVAQAQSATPSAVTPQTLRPEKSDNGLRVDIPESAALKPPAGSEGLMVRLGSVVVEGGFSEVVAESQAVIDRLRGQTVTLAQIYDAASQIEAAHARAGFVLARVVIPPQDIQDGGTLRIVVVDGFIEQVDVSAVPDRVRPAVARRLTGLEGRKHVRLGDIEQALLLANDVPGLTLRSTLMRGSQPGGTKLVIEGRHQLVSGSLGTDDSLAKSLGTWSVNGQVSLNSAFGWGEQIYGFVSSGDDLGKLFADDPRVRVVGAGAVLPVGDGRLTLNPEVTLTRTQPKPSQGAPITVGDLQRLALRAGYTLHRTRKESLLLNGSVEQLDESNKAPQFALTLSRDRYTVGRLGIELDRSANPRASWGVAAEVSQGLGGRSRAEVLASGIGYSRVGASNDFTKMTAQAHALVSLSSNWDWATQFKAQTTGGRAVFRGEQFQLEGSDGLSGFIGGETAVDDGGAVRFEFRHRPFVWAGAAVAPYLFAADGAGSNNRPTGLEPSNLRLSTLGAGAHITLGRVYIRVEYAHGTSNFAPLGDHDRVNATASVRF